MQGRLPPLWEAFPAFANPLFRYSSDESERIATRQGDSTINTNVPATSRLCILSLLNFSFNFASLAHIAAAAHASIVPFARQTSHHPLPPLRNFLKMSVEPLAHLSHAGVS